MSRYNKQQVVRKFLQPSTIDCEHSSPSDCLTLTFCIKDFRPENGPGRQEEVARGDGDGKVEWRRKWCQYCKYHVREVIEYIFINQTLSLSLIDVVPGD